MWMVGSLAGSRFKRITSRDDRALCGTQGIEDGLRKLGGPDIRRERLAVDRNVHATLAYVNRDRDAVTKARLGKRKQCYESGASQRDVYSAPHHQRPVPRPGSNFFGYHIRRAVVAS